MENIFIVSLLLLTGATGFAIGALFGVVLAGVRSRAQPSTVG
jgi:tetrahydromethanopterin S-methyltransferase subunit F